MTTPYRFQKKGVRKIDHFNGRALVADEMGLGKSLQALLWQKKRGIKLTVIVCPASIKWNWAAEASKHLNLRSEIIEGTKVPRTRRLITPHQIIIINYDILSKWLKFIKALKPELIIIDECHYIANPDAKRTKAVKALCHKVPYVLGLSGTPLTNRPVEMWTILNILRPDVFDVFYVYGERYCKPKMTPWGLKYTGASNLNELHEICNQTCMVRRLKKDVLKDLPSRLISVVPMLLPAKDRKEYDTAITDFVGWVAKNWGNAKARRAAKAEQVTRIGYLKRLAAVLKFKGVLEWMEDWLAESDGKLIMFGVHKTILRPMHEHFAKLAVRVDGSVTGKHRQQAFETFVQNKKCRLLVGGLRPAGVGWSAKGCSTVGFSELGWTPGEHSQAMDRVYGIGRGVEGEPSSAYFLVASGTIEERLCEVIQSKSETLSAVLDGGREVEQLDIFDLLTEELLLKKKKR